MQETRYPYCEFLAQNGVNLQNVYQLFLKTLICGVSSCIVRPKLAFLVTIYVNLIDSFTLHLNLFIKLTVRFEKNIVCEGAAKLNFSSLLCFLNIYYRKTFSVLFHYTGADLAKQTFWRQHTVWKDQPIEYSIIITYNIITSV